MATPDLNANSRTSAAAGYQVVARRYRPQRFDELVGQEHVARGLSGAIESGRIGHAYLFTGARGVGKTSAARIFAKALAMSGAQVEESLMIGDDHETDMRGARNAGWDQVHFAAENTPDTSATYRVAHMDELRPILL